MTWFLEARYTDGGYETWNFDEKPKRTAGMEIEGPNNHLEFYGKLTPTDRKGDKAGEPQDVEVRLYERALMSFCVSRVSV